MSDAPKDHRREELLAYEQGFLTDEERAELEAHLRDCSECQATLERVKRFLPALDKALASVVISDEEMLARVKAQLRAKQAQPAGFFTRMQLAWLVLAAAAASVIFIVVQPLMRQGTSGVVAAPQRPSGVVAAPRRPPEDYVDASPDAGVDAGLEPDR